MKTQILEDIAISTVLQEDEDHQEVEGFSDLGDVDLLDTFDIYSCSTQDLFNHYRVLMNKYKESGIEVYKDTAELIEVELAKNGYEINPEPEEENTNPRSH